MPPPPLTAEALDLVGRHAARAGQPLLDAGNLGCSSSSGGGSSMCWQMWAGMSEASRWPCLHSLTGPWLIAGCPQLAKLQLQCTRTCVRSASTLQAAPTQELPQISAGCAPVISAVVRLEPMRTWFSVWPAISARGRAAMARTCGLAAACGSLLRPRLSRIQQQAGGGLLALT